MTRTPATPGRTGSKTPSARCSRVQAFSCSVWRLSPIRSTDTSPRSPTSRKMSPTSTGSNQSKIRAGAAMHSAPTSPCRTAPSIRMSSSSSRTPANRRSIAT
ncbi:hypothetical protein ACFFX0_31900 [Citricoccus parietis]|uniref:Uncharacterized protein n=1 Tax=Citricoccus parietis TaxID=592307 RepID=A0ABV5G9D5_9MICC